MGDSVESPPLRLSDLWAMLCRRRKVAMVAGAIAGMAMLFMPALIAPPLFRADATLSANRGLKPVTGYQDDPTAGQVPEQLLNTQRELLTSEAVLANAMSMGGLAGNPAYTNAAAPVEVLRKRLRTAVVKNSWVITVSLDDEDPVRAEQGLQGVLDAFLSRQTTSSRERTQHDLDFLADQVADAERKLDGARRAERDFRGKNGIASTDPDRNHITERIDRLAAKQAELDNLIAASAALLKQIRAADAIVDPKLRQTALLSIDTVSKFTVVGALQTDLFQLEGQEAELSAQYLDKHPRLIEVRSHIATKRAQIDETIAAARANIESDHALLVDQSAGLQKSMEELHGELSAYREHLVELQRLEVETARLQKFDEGLVARHAQALVLADYDDRRMAIDSPPRSSPVRTGLGWAPTLALALVAAMATALVATAIADALDRSVRDAEAIRKMTGLACLGTLPESSGLQAVGATGPSDPPLIAEALRAVHAALRFRLPPEPGCRVLVIASPTSGDGRSVLASRLAAGMAVSGLRVLLVDADLRNPVLATQLGCDSPTGLTQILIGEPDIAPLQTRLPNLDLMPAGVVAANPGELLNSHCLGEWLTHVRGRYDAVIIDTPALGECSDALTIGANADAVILLAAIGTTPTSNLDDTWHQLEPLRPRVIGFVANRAQGAAVDSNLS